MRNPSLSREPYVARFEIHQIIPLTRDWEENEDRGPITSFKMVPRHRLELRVGKMSTVDLFDINPAGSDSHLQFMNWTVDNNGAYDYAADTRGYTYGLVVEYQGPFVEVRFGEMLMPTVANGIDIDFDLDAQPRRAARGRAQVSAPARAGRARCACSATRTSPTWATTRQPIDALPRPASTRSPTSRSRATSATPSSASG